MINFSYRVSLFISIFTGLIATWLSFNKELDGLYSFQGGWLEFFKVFTPSLLQALCNGAVAATFVVIICLGIFNFIENKMHDAEEEKRAALKALKEEES